MFRPPRAAGVSVGVALASLAAAAGITVGFIAARSEPEFRTFLALLAAGALMATALVFASWTVCIASMAYVVRPGGLVIRWGLRRIVVPLATVEGILPGRSVDEIQVRGLNWPGCHVGSADLRRVGFTLVYATDINPEGLVFISTTDESYAISLRNPAAFAEEIQAHRRLVRVEHRVQRATASGIAALPLWRDQTAMAALLLAATACALVVGYVFSQYPSLPAIIELDFPGRSSVVRVGSKEEVLRIAYAAAGIFVFSTVAGGAIHARDRAAGLWLLASGSALQAVLLAAAALTFSR